MITVHIKTKSTLNLREHYAAKAKRIKGERDAVRDTLRPWLPDPLLPRAVLLTRHGSRLLDDDNVRGALKGVRDEVAAWLGIDDADPRVQWCYAQQKCKRVDERVTIDLDHVTREQRMAKLLERWLGVAAEASVGSSMLVMRTRALIDEVER